MCCGGAGAKEVVKGFTLELSKEMGQHWNTKERSREEHFHSSSMGAEPKLEVRVSPGFYLKP